ncbi:SpoIIIAH-like family protein [Sporosarcina sp. CAU 1771]
MKANKRTVWFLTLISLVAVISIFYMNNNPKPFDGIALFGEGKPKVTNDDKANETDIQTPVFAESYIFDDMRMTVRNERSLLNDQLTSKILNAGLSSDEKNEAYDQMEALIKLDSIETLMEMQIIALGYPDAFVKTDKGQVNVRVLTMDGQSKKQANEIMHLVMTTWEEARNVKVDFETGS